MQNQLEIPEFVTPCLPGIQHDYYGNYHLQYSNVTSSLLVLTDDAFFSAIKTGDLSLVKKFFPKFKNVINQIRTPSGLYPLHLATIKGHYEIVKYLVEEQNALVDIVDNEKETPLLKASYNGYKNIVSFLKKKNANINYKDREGWTALHNACSRGFTDIAQLLINSDADINVQNLTGQTPLMIACSKGHVNIIQLLIMTNVNPLIKNNLGETAYDIAAQNSEYYICIMLENYEKVYAKKNKLGKDQIYHHTAIEVVFENQRSSMLSLNSFSSENLQKNDKCGPWSNKYGVPCGKDDVQLPQSDSSNGWFWMTDWKIDLKSPNVNKKDGWQYAKSFEDKPELWSAEPIKGLSSIVGCVRRRVWIRIRKRKYVMMSSLNNEIQKSSLNTMGASSSQNTPNPIINNNGVPDNDNNIPVIPTNLSNSKGKNAMPTTTDNLNEEPTHNPNSEDISDVSLYLSQARDIVNEEEYSWEYISKTETNLYTIENQFNKYTEAIEYLLKMNKENNLKSSKEMSNHIEIYLKKAEYLKEKIKRLKGSTDDINNNEPGPFQRSNSSLNEDEGSSSQPALNQSSSLESQDSPSTTQWEKDENAPLCNGCKSKFSLFNRRHHCRNCGKVFCAKCSNYQFKLQKEGQPLRVCKNCYKNLTKDRLNAVDGQIILPPENDESMNSSEDELIECPVCGKSLALYGSDQNNIENHLKTCLDQVNGHDNKVKLGNRFELQKLDHDLGSECPICFEEFLKGQTIARIDCLCIFHKDCIDRWYDYRKVDGICPIHSMDD